MAMQKADIDPAAALEILPRRIADTEKTLQEMRLDRSVIASVEGHSPEQLEQLNKSIRFHEAIKAEYQARLDRLKAAANGEPVGNRAARRAAAKEATK